MVAPVTRDGRLARGSGEDLELLRPGLRIGNDRQHHDHAVVHGRVEHIAAFQAELTHRHLGDGHLGWGSTTDGFTLTTAVSKVHPGSQA
jgi:hypothetical protein